MNPKLQQKAISILPKKSLGSIKSLSGPAIPCLAIPQLKLHTISQSVTNALVTLLVMVHDVCGVSGDESFDIVQCRLENPLYRLDAIKRDVRRDDHVFAIQ